jgi:hypothetical protein
MDPDAPKTEDIPTDTREVATMEETLSATQAISYKRYNSPFWQIIIVSLVAFG